MDSDSDIDITSLLNNQSNPNNDNDSDSDDDIFKSIPSLSRAKNLAEGTALIKSSKSLKQTRGITGGGSFQALGLPPSLLKALLQRGFTTPTPIQRLALPSILGSVADTSISSSNGGVGGKKKLVVARDHLCMARTGSGKTLCYLLPLLAQLLKHDTAFGARALILVPTRELALQVLKVGKDLARGIRGEGEALRWAMVVGGEGMEEQFALMASNPDVIIATPGRLLHLLVEMSLSLQSVQYCVFDEADRLFELGFAEQLHEILHRLPASRQTLLFSATLPGSLVGFAKAGLQSPKLIRLDVDSKISKELQMAYLSVKDGEKEAALLSLLREVIGVPLMSDEQRKAQKKKEIEIREEQDASDKARAKGKSRKRKRDEEEAPGEGGKVDPAAHQTLVFVSTKHHVEYLSSLLSCAGYSVSPIYGSMDQTARLLHLAAFRANRTSILVVTDLAARGIDIPGVENVVNYDFPNGPRAFVHRVGRTARAGRKGWAYTMVTMKELPHLLDLELFLGRPVKTCPLSAAPSSSTSPIEPEDVDYSTNLILGTVPRQLLDLDLEAHRALFTQFPHLPNLSAVSKRGQKMYEKGLQHASPASYRRSKILERAGEGLATSAGEGRGVHPVFGDFIKGFGEGKGDDEEKRANLMKFVNGFTPGETVFELGARGRASEGAKLMKERRKAMQKSHNARALAEEDEIEEEGKGLELVDEEDEGRVAGIVDEADAAEVEAVFGAPRKRQKPSGPGASYKDPQFYLNYEQEGADTERGYALTAGDSFVAQAAQAQYDVSGRGDTEGISADALLQRASTLRWDRRTKKFVKGDGLGADNKKLIKSESGQKLPASFKSGVYDDWRKKNRISVPKNGEGELKGVKIPGLAGGGAGRGGEKHYRHKAGVPKTDAERRKGRTVGKPGRLGSVGGGLKSADEVRKARVQKAKRVARSTQPGKGKKTGPGTGGGPPKKSRK